MPYDVQEMEFVEGDNSESSQVSYGPSIICTSEIKRVLITTNSKKWENVSEYKLKEHCSSAKSLQTLSVKELSEITKIVGSRLGKRLKTYGMKKAELINQLSDTIADGSRLEVTPTRVKSKSVCSLKTLASRVIKKKEYPKQVLNIAYANFVWPDRVQQWHESVSVNETVTIVGLENTLVPYYVPDKDPKTGNFELFVYDKTHLGSNLRKTICLDKIEGISKDAWVRVAQCIPLILNPALIDVTEEGKILDQMKEKLTRTMLSEEVEETMIANGDTIEANFCAITRGALYEAEDIPGIPTVERCRKRLRLIEWLKSGVDFGDFPTYGAKIKGMSSILYEGLRSSNEGKLYLYALAKKGTYCARAPNTLCSETFFGSMQEMDPWGQGVLSTTGVEKHMSDFITVTAMRMDQNRNFYIRTKKDAAYPVDSVSTTVEGHIQQTSVQQTPRPPVCTCKMDRYIRCIVPRDHYFDTVERARLTKKEKPYKLSGTRGDLPVRAQYGYRINETKLLQSKLMGINYN